MELAHWEREAGGSLEDLEGADDGPSGLIYLDAGSTGADNGAAFALDVDAGIGPEGRMVDYVFKFVEPAKAFLWGVALRREPGSEDEVFGLGDVVVFGFNVPAAFFGGELGVEDNASEGAVPLSRELCRRGRGIGATLSSLGIWCSGSSLSMSWGSNIGIRVCWDRRPLRDSSSSTLVDVSRSLFLSAC